MKEKTVGSARKVCHVCAERGASADVTNTLAGRLLGQYGLKQVNETVFAASPPAKGFAGTLIDTYCGLVEYKDADCWAGTMLCKSEPKPQFASRAS